jgi:hypothetical protein
MEGMKALKMLTNLTILSSAPKDHLGRNVRQATRLNTEPPYGREYALYMVG